MDCISSYQNQGVQWNKAYLERDNSFIDGEYELSDFDDSEFISYPDSPEESPSHTDTQISSRFTSSKGAHTIPTRTRHQTCIPYVSIPDKRVCTVLIRAGESGEGRYADIVTSDSIPISKLVYRVKEKRSLNQQQVQSAEATEEARFLLTTNPHPYHTGLRCLVPILPLNHLEPNTQSPPQQNLPRSRRQIPTSPPPRIPIHPLSQYNHIRRSYDRVTHDLVTTLIELLAHKSQHIHDSSAYMPADIGAALQDYTQRIADLARNAAGTSALTAQNELRAQISLDKCDAATSALGVGTPALFRRAVWQYLATATWLVYDDTQVVGSSSDNGKKDWWQTTVARKRLCKIAAWDWLVDWLNWWIDGLVEEKRWLETGLWEDI